MMRSLGLALVFSLFFVGFAEAKIAYAPFNLVIEESDMGKAAKTFMESKLGKDYKALEKEFADLQKKDKSFQNKVQEFQKQAAALSEKARNQKAKELDNEVNAMRKQAAELDKKRGELAQKAKPIQDKVNLEMMKVLQQATEVVAQEKQLELILDAAPPVYYVANSLSIKDDILKEVNKIWKESGGKFK